MSLNPHREKIYTILFFTAACCVIVVGFKLNELLSYEKLYKLHLEKEKNIGNSQINQLLYDYHNKKGFNKFILTDYGFLAHLPTLKEYYYFQNFIAQQKSNFLLFLDNIEDTTIGFLLLPNYSDKSIFNFVEINIADSNFIPIFKQDEYLFVKLR